MKLYLMRHGDALSSDVDSERQLSDLGKRQVSAVARFCANGNIVPEKIMHSPKVRARDTAEIMRETIAPHIEKNMLEGVLPMDPVETVSSMLGIWNADVLLVGHQPFLGNLASNLLTGKSNGVTLQIGTATMLCLQREPTGFWRLEWLVPPSVLLGDS